MYITYFFNKLYKKQLKEILINFLIEKNIEYNNEEIQKLKKKEIIHTLLFKGYEFQNLPEPAKSAMRKSRKLKKSYLFYRYLL